MPIEWVIPAVALLLLVWGIIIHRRLVALREVAVAAWSEAEAAFRKRHEMVSRLIEKAGGALGAEAKSIRAVAEARRLAATAQDPERIGKAEAALSLAIERLLARASGHADLKADAGFLRLQARLPDMQVEIETARDVFNEAVEDFNHARLGFLGTVLGYVIKIPPLEPLAVPRPAEPEPARSVMRL